MNPMNILRYLGQFFGPAKRPLPAAYRGIPETSQHADKSRDSVLLIDASISMNQTDWKPSRSVAAQNAAITFTKRRASEDPDSRIAIVAYGDEAASLSGLTVARRCRKLARSINSVTVMGNTNITASLEMAFNLLQSSRCLGQVVLLTDGCHNTGPEPHDISEKLKKRAIIECVGIGGSPEDVDEELLRYIASPYPDGSKRYRWIGDKERLAQHFHNLAGRITRVKP